MLRSSRRAFDVRDRQAEGGLHDCGVTKRAAGARDESVASVDRRARAGAARARSGAGSPGDSDCVRPRQARRGRRMVAKPRTADRCVKRGVFRL